MCEPNGKRHSVFSWVPWSDILFAFADPSASFVFNQDSKKRVLVNFLRAEGSCKTTLTLRNTKRLEDVSLMSFVSVHFHCLAFRQTFSLTLIIRNTADLVFRSKSPKHKKAQTFYLRDVDIDLTAEDVALSLKNVHVDFLRISNNQNDFNFACKSTEPSSLRHTKKCKTTAL